MFMALWSLQILVDWRDNWVALTTRRLIFMDKTLMLRETRREAPLQKVQNVVAEYTHPLSMAFDFGDLKVDTAGIGTLQFKGMPQPRNMREAIFAQQKAISAAQPPPEDRRKESIRTMLGSPASAGSLGAQASRLHPSSGVGGAPGRYGTLAKAFPFAPQRQESHVTWHKHWFFLLRGLAWPSLVYGMALAGWVLSALLGGDGLSGARELFAWAVVLLMPFCLAWALWAWEDWRNDLYRLDHERVYDIESLPFGLREQSKETLISRVTDVAYLVSGPVAAMLDYGDVLLKTPGEATEFIFRGVPHPRQVQAEIMSRVDVYRRKGNAGTDKEIESWLKAYHDVVGGGAMPGAESQSSTT